MNVIYETNRPTESAGRSFVTRWPNGYALGLCTVRDAGSIPALVLGAASLLTGRCRPDFSLNKRKPICTQEKKLIDSSS
jgi:hypothetical protein